MAPISGKTHYLKNILIKVTNAPHLISPSEPLAQKLIVVEKLRYDIYVLSGATGATGASITP